ncbi:MAG: efflux RND transporter periplasmic adaptor subunit [Deltaproteobacteria bacterium]|nr:efflux RND transporter periplasmic adaptor subunit [Deltaproteobacteria bacterium]
MERIPPGRRDDKGHLHTAEGPSDGQGSDPERQLWQRFAEATTPRGFCQSWLAIQCHFLAGVECAMVLLGPPDEGPFTPIAFWPNAQHDMTHLTGAVERALKERRGLLLEGNPAPDSQNPQPESYHVAYPIEVTGKLHGVVVLEVARRPQQEVQAILRLLHWGAAWLEVMLRRSEALQSTELSQRLQHVLDALVSAVEQVGFQAAAMGFVTKLATIFECDRVSLGFLRGQHTRVAVLSHSTAFGKQTNLVRAIGTAMDEAIDQNAVIIHPLPPDEVPLVLRAHEALAQQHGAGAILTIPLAQEGRFFGALTLERPPDKPFTQSATQACETAAALAGPILKTMRAEERWIFRKLADSLATQLGRLFGRGHLLRKLGLVAMLGLAYFFYTAEVDYRVTAPTSIEGAVQRVVAAPFNSYVKEAKVRPGDIVKKGDLLCLLDDRDLKLERLKWLTEKEQLTKQYHEAMAKHDRSQYRIIKAKIGQADAQIALLEEQLARTTVLAPFKGVVMSGDLSQSLGAPVERGQVLFEVAPLDEYRVISEVDEQDISEIAVGQQSELLLPSLPGAAFPFVVSKITPVSTAKEGRNTFRVEGRMLGASERLRPGMEGVGKISIDRRKLIWVWTHQMIDWFRLQIWRWRP